MRGFEEEEDEKLDISNKKKPIREEKKSTALGAFVNEVSFFEN
jgi:hypothetical protein